VPENVILSRSFRKFDCTSGSSEQLLYQLGKNLGPGPRNAVSFAITRAYGLAAASNCGGFSIPQLEHHLTDKSDSVESVSISSFVGSIALEIHNTKPQKHFLALICVHDTIRIQHTQVLVN
jgi:hypothetical protein